VGDDVFQLDELVNPYRVALSNYLEENSKFYIAENTFINVDIEELKDVLRTNKYTQVDEEDDRNEINV
jgi:regulator of replication initiation timing